MVFEEIIEEIDDVKDIIELEEIAEEYKIEPSCGMTRNMFKRKAAELADKKRKEEYQKIVYKKLQERKEEQEDEYSR